MLSTTHDQYRKTFLGEEEAGGPSGGDSSPIHSLSMVSVGGRQKAFERAQRKGRAMNVQSLQDGLWGSGCTDG